MPLCPAPGGFRRGLARVCSNEKGRGICVLCQPWLSLWESCRRSRLILKPVKKLEKLFIAPKVRQVLYETSQRVFTRCACAQRTGFLIKFFNQESVSENMRPHPSGCGRFFRAEARLRRPAFPGPPCAGSRTEWRWPAPARGPAAGRGQCGCCCPGGPRRRGRWPRRRSW